MLLQYNSTVYVYHSKYNWQGYIWSPFGCLVSYNQLGFARAEKVICHPSQSHQTYWSSPNMNSSPRHRHNMLSELQVIWNKRRLLKGHEHRVGPRSRLKPHGPQLSSPWLNVNWGRAPTADDPADLCPQDSMQSSQQVKESLCFSGTWSWFSGWPLSRGRSEHVAECWSLKRYLCFWIFKNKTHKIWSQNYS